MTIISQWLLLARPRAPAKWSKTSSRREASPFRSSNQRLRRPRRQPPQRRNRLRQQPAPHSHSTQTLTPAGRPTQPPLQKCLPEWRASKPRFRAEAAKSPPANTCPTTDKPPSKAELRHRPPATHPPPTKLHTRNTSSEQHEFTRTTHKQHTPPPLFSRSPSKEKHATIFHRS